MCHGGAKTNDMSIFIKNLKLFRKLNGLTQTDFAEKMSLKRCTVGAYEEGRAEPSIKKFLEICDLYNISPSDFYNIEFTVETADDVRV